MCQKDKNCFVLHARIHALRKRDQSKEIGKKTKKKENDAISRPLAPTSSLIIIP